MAFLEQYSIHTRKRIALGITVGVGVVLIFVMVLVYSSNKKAGFVKPDGTTSTFSRLYATILENTQSFFSSKDDIISK